MKKLLTSGRACAVAALIAVSMCAGAQFLGAPVAEAWIGQPLQVTVPARFASADADDACVQADVLYGDMRVAPGRVHTTVSGAGEQRRIRIESDAPVNDAVVTVSVRAGCRNTITRNYTLLPDVPSETVLARLGAPSTALAAATPSSPLRLATGTSPEVRPPLRRAIAARAELAQASPAANHRARHAPASRVKVAPGGSRLKLEPVDVGADSPLLRASDALADPAGDPSRRAAAALLWQAINADPQEVLRTTVMLHQLEAEMAQLQRNASQTHAEVAALRQRLDEARPWYLSRGLVQALAWLVAAAAIAAGVLWLRTRRSDAAAERWYAPADDPLLDQVVDVTHEEDGAAAAREPVRPVVVAAQPAAAAPQRPLAPVVAAGPVVQAAQSAPATTGPIDFEVPERATDNPPRRATTGVLRVETLAATLEEVEFLSSLGLTVDATDVLKTYLSDSTNPAPLAFYELMRLCADDEDQTALAAVRRRYTQVFGQEAPRPEQLAAPMGLDSMPALGARLTQAWGRGEALEIIEDALFALPAAGSAFTLQLGRELICLYDIALALATESTGQASADLESHSLAPWAHSDNVLDACAAAQAAAEASGGHRFALDVDLGAAAEPLPGAVRHETGELSVAPMLAEMQATAAREAAERTQRVRQEEEDAFSAAVASERMR